MGVWNAIECWFLQRLVLEIRSPHIMPTKHAEQEEIDAKWLGEK